MSAINSSVQLRNTPSELSQRLFGVIKPAAAVQPQQHQQSQNDDKQTGAGLTTQISLLQFNEPQDVITNLPKALSLKVRSTFNINAHQQQQEQQHCITSNTNSLLKQQLRSGPKDMLSNTSVANEPASNGIINADFSCSALQSLASVAERQTPNAIQPPSANNLHHQFLLHMAANPMLKPSVDFFRHQQEQQQQQSHASKSLSDIQAAQESDLQQDDSLSPTNMDLILDQTDKSEPELMLVDETAGLDYKNADNSLGNLDEPNSVAITTITISDSPDNENTETTANANTLRMEAAANQPNTQCTNNNSGNNEIAGGGKSNTRRPAPRRRIRRKAQSTIDDQAEHLTEMSVRGLDLFRYARIQEGVYQCTECAKEDLQKTFKNKYSFQRHAFLYHEGKVRKVFPCTLCGKEFSRPDKMKNHLKMAHENFVARDANSFNPLNYLISAATAEEMHTAIFTASAVAQQQQQESIAKQQQQQQKQQEIQQHRQQQQQHQLQLQILDDYRDNGITNAMLSERGRERDQENSRPTSPTAPAFALLQMHSDLTIKSEIIISPSPSPEPLISAMANVAASVTQSTPTPTAPTTTSANMSMLEVKRITQRLEEVK